MKSEVFTEGQQVEEMDKRVKSNQVLDSIVQELATQGADLDIFADQISDIRLAIKTPNREASKVIDSLVEVLATETKIDLNKFDIALLRQVTKS
ncbi:MAG: hypothetical protein WCW14_01280 [Candidatus Paceibacterota bacterium]|jgi:hypothetical protein